MIAVLLVLAFFAPQLAQHLEQAPNEQDVFHRLEQPLTMVEMNFLEKKKALLNYFEQNPDRANSILGIFRAQNPSSLSDLETLATKLALVRKERLDEQLSPLPLPKDFLRLTERFQRFHWLGTDELGRDVLVRLLYGTRVSLGVALLVAMASALIGLLVGGIAGYYGGWIDTTLMRLTDALLSLPLLPVLVIVAAMDFAKIPWLKKAMTGDHQAALKLVLILCLFSWMGVARLVRSNILSLKDREFVLAAKSLGATDAMIMLRHFLPNIMGPLGVAISLCVSESILFEAALSYLGMGVQPPTPSWGNMLFNAQEIVSIAPALAIAPGLLIVLTTLSFNFIGDATRR